ncbi:unnamed protein product [Orchesella dallaii]|uniref:Uncharacterized protein n=1 Tax=Orchesella dallaii TaxID=48710 RepID=A0ABP1QBU2_9HEXA
MRNKNELAILNQDGTLKQIKSGSLQNEIVGKDISLIVGKEWTLVETSGTRICLSLAATVADSYCFFSNSEDLDWELEKVEEGCEEYNYFVDPTKCYTIGKEGQDICEEEIVYRRLYKRDTESQQGRIFLPTLPEDTGNGTNETAPVVETAIVDPNATLWLPMDDEDYFNATGNNTKTIESPSVATELWNQIDMELNEILGLSKPTNSDETGRSDNPGMENPKTTRRRKGRSANVDTLAQLNLTYKNPVYEFLEISKRIMKKTCPPYYVKPTFLDLAIGSFIRIQQVHYKFPENTFKHSGFLRVLEALKSCEANATQINFTSPGCDGKVSGNMSVYGEFIELHITRVQSPLDRDPIIETTWKVFFNAHSICYHSFNKLYNDHHRFTTWMMPLFQNGINDLWVKGRITETSLGGLFGNQIEVQDNLAMCASASRMETDYPWDLPRPQKSTAFMSKVIRRKRDLENSAEATGNCMDLDKPMVCANIMLPH